MTAEGILEFKANRDQLLGTWRLVSWVRHLTETGETIEPFGKTPSGFLSYGRDGRMLGLMVSDRRPKPSDLTKVSDKDRVELFNTLAAYGGTFEVSGTQVVHKVDISWNETWTGTTQVRDFSLDGDRLTISIGPHVGIDGRRSTALLIFGRVQSPADVT
jgi:Lipocalin-like domain